MSLDTLVTASAPRLQAPRFRPLLGEPTARVERRAAQVDDAAGVLGGVGVGADARAPQSRPQARRASLAERLANSPLRLVWNGRGTAVGALAMALSLGAIGLLAMRPGSHADAAGSPGVVAELESPSAGDAYPWGERRDEGTTVVPPGATVPPAPPRAAASPKGDARPVLVAGLAGPLPATMVAPQADDAPRGGHPVEAATEAPTAPTTAQVPAQAPTQLAPPAAATAAAADADAPATTRVAQLICGASQSPERHMISAAIWKTADGYSAALARGAARWTGRDNAMVLFDKGAHPTAPVGADLVQVGFDRPDHQTATPSDPGANAWLTMARADVAKLDLSTCLMRIVGK